MSFCQRRLLRLTALQVIARFRPQRVIGTHPYHYLLDQLGHEIVAAQRGDELPRPSVARANRQNLTSRVNLAHLTGTNDVFIQLAGHARTHPEATLLRWWPPSRAFQLAALDPSAYLAVQRMLPDGAGVWRDGDRTVPFYLEYDRGTEPLGTLLDKIERYEGLARSTDWPWPVLLWLPTTTRELHLHQQLSHRGVRLRTTVATAAVDRVVAAGRSAADDVWWPYLHTGHVRLGALPYNGPDPIADSKVTS